MFRRLLSLRDNPVDVRTRFTLLHASRNPAELPPLPILQPLIDFASAHPDHLRVRLFVDNDAAQVPKSIARFLQVGKIDKRSITHALGISDARWSWPSWTDSLWTTGRSSGGDDEDIRKKNVLVLVCGPEPYVPLTLSLSFLDHQKSLPFQDGGGYCRSLW